MKKVSHSNKGWNLIELLVVISIIGIMFAMVVGVLQAEPIPVERIEPCPPGEEVIIH